jgi:hypothetical protein
MNEGPVNQGAMIETTDCLEAAGVFRGWKNLFFMVMVVCLLLVQAAFWLVDLQIVPAGGAGSAPVASAAPADANAVTGAPADSSQPSSRVAGAAKLSAQLLGKLDAGHLARTIELVNGILIVTVVLYVLAMFFNLLVSLVGRLGGIRHISRAFFLSVIVLVLIIPWQTLIGSCVPGVVYTLPELLHRLASKNENLVNTVLYYLRFSGYWLVFLLLVLVCQLRSARWTKSILRRLEII